MEPKINDEHSAAIKEMLFGGRKIAAIKFYRELTGMGLKEAKEAIEELEAMLRTQYPEKFVPGARGSGCFSFLLLWCLVGAVVIYWMARS